MRAITIEDVTKYAVPGNLTWNPSRTVAAFEVTRSQLDKNQYQTDIWLYENGEVRQLTAGLSSGILAWNDDCHLYLRRSSSDTKPGDPCGAAAVVSFADEEAGLREMGGDRDH